MEIAERDLEAIDSNTSDHEEENGNGNGNGNKWGERTWSFLNLYKVPKKQPKEYPTMQTFLLAYQSLGVVYGDIGTSPLYVFSATTIPNPEEKDICGIMSLIFWTLTVIGLIKYVCIVLHANDHGEGGTFALYSLLCQHINFRNKMPRLDSDLNLRFHSKGTTIQSKAKLLMEKSKRAQGILTSVVLFGVCMIIGDGALTPAISVLSAVDGIQSRNPKIDQTTVVLLSVMILLALFLFQRFGTSKVSASFSPIMLIWFTSISSVGMYNIITYYPTIFKALSPHYIYYFFARHGKTGWELLGTVVLCITGAEAMFADMGHFNRGAIQTAFSAFVYPALVITYAGQAAYVIKNPENMSTTFYSSLPDPVFWPIFVVATLAAIVASQAMISASFCIIRQAVALGCFPRVNMIHTSDKHEGQVYSPEVNYFLMVVCILIVVSFRGGVALGNAYGVAVIWDMLITTTFMTIVMLVVWNKSIVLASLFFLTCFFVEGVYMTSLLNKVPQGGWVPFAIAGFLLVITSSWTYGRTKKSEYEAERKMSQAELTQLVSSDEVSRVPGICFFCTDLVNGVPPIIRHYVQNVGSLREIMVIVTLRTIPIKTVLPEERFLVAKLVQKGVYRCLVQYGYKDIPDMEGEEYVASVVEKLKEQAESPEEMQLLDSASGNGISFVMGRVILNSSDKNGWLSRVVLNNVYRFLQKNFRSTVSTLKVPPSNTLQVGMLYEI